MSSEVYPLQHTSLAIEGGWRTTSRGCLVDHERVGEGL